MAETLTPFEEFKRLKGRQARPQRNAGSAAAEHAAHAAYAALVALIQDTARLVKRLDHGAEHSLAQAIARAAVAERAELVELARARPRLSWRPDGQLRAILDAARKW